MIGPRSKSGPPAGKLGVANTKAAAAGVRASTTPAGRRPSVRPTVSSTWSMLLTRRAVSTHRYGKEACFCCFGDVLSLICCFSGLVG